MLYKLLINTKYMAKGETYKKEKKKPKKVR